jgi:hypothetical protein
MIKTEFKWIVFEERPATGKTKMFLCINKEYKSQLGVVKWYGPFRKYSFFPLPDIVFETDCLKNIASFLESLMLERKIEKQNSQQ